MRNIVTINMLIFAQYLFVSLNYSVASAAVAAAVANECNNSNDMPPSRNTSNQTLLDDSLKNSSQQLPVPNRPSAPLLPVHSIHHHHHLLYKAYSAG